MPETPLETAQRLWPGEWEGSSSAGALYRRLWREDGLRIEAIFLNDGGVWDGYLRVNLEALHPQRATDLDDVLITIRNRVQSMARDFARAAGLEVPGE